MGTPNKRRKFKLRMIFLLIASVAVLGTAFAFLYDASARKEIQELKIGKIDFARLQDGTYVGKYEGTKGSMRNATVKVTIFGGEIKGITILKGALDPSGNAAKLTDGMTIESLFQTVLEAKSLQVDAISGATLTSKVHLKALENALQQAQKNN